MSSLNLLVPLDGSPLAEQALPFAQMLAGLVPTTIRLLRVIPPGLVNNLVRYEAVLLGAAGDTMGDRDEQQENMREALQSEAETYLKHHADVLAEHANKVEIEVAFGTPADQIVAIAQRSPETMIVMATHGKSGLLRWALGSVTTRVLQQSTHSTLVVRGAEEGVRPASPSLRRMMVCLDGSITAERALPLATGLAHVARAEVLLSQVIDPVEAPIATLSTDAATGRLRELAFGYLDHIAEGIARDVGRHVTTSVPVGYVAEEIVEEAARKHIDMIVIGRQGVGSSTNSFLGGTAEKVTQASNVPLLVTGA
ncbi:UspA domain-containing protein [Oscillochloris trichoides DG-6]|uniref:UspA domain-containing protein n=1 Tax=Oscillochloris trichoides DG-6 TaxID=765420 RepID=E1IDR6_9CHLR|nr:UspA domain-containing protein [Oscillochloris trichoides DG-6]